MRARVLIGGNDDWHDLVGSGTRLKEILAGAGIAATMRVGCGEQQLGGPETGALVMYTNGMRMRTEEQERLAARVTGGLGLVAVHMCCVDAEPPGVLAVWLGLIGCRFVHHPPFGRFTVRMDRAHPVTEGVGDFEIEDELYITEPAGEPVEVLASALHEGKRHPMVTVREAGRGRVCYLALGHDGRAQHHPAFARLLVQAARWAGRATD